MQKLRNLLKSIFARSKKISIPSGELILNICEKNIGTSFSVNQPYGFTEAVNRIIKLATGSPIGGENSDPMMYWFMKEDSRRFIQVTDALPGDIIISQTGCGKNPSDVGFVGIIGKNGKIFAHDPQTGKFSDEFRIESWVSFYRDVKGFPVEFFRLK